MELGETAVGFKDWVTLIKGDPLVKETFFCGEIFRVALAVTGLITRGEIELIIFGGEALISYWIVLLGIKEVLN